MNLTLQSELYNYLTEVLENKTPANWGEITEVLSDIKNTENPVPDPAEFLENAAAGTAFITFEYGIDGVSIEIAKYASSLEEIYAPFGEPAIHTIAGHYHPQASSVLKAHWPRFRLKGINGWAKWDRGKWFTALYEQDMPEGGKTSNKLAKNIFNQSASIAKKLGKYLVDNQITLLIPVNIATNPGNLAATLGVIFVTEALGTYVINSNHDFYWEDGKLPEERLPSEEPGTRDHFFRNAANTPFFNLFKSFYPWKGKRWLQVNINRLQSNTLIKKWGFPQEHVYEIPTSTSDKFLKPYGQEEITSSRLRMAHILSNGQAVMHSIPIVERLDRIDQWMADQKPCILGARPGLTVDPLSNHLIILLQPTRVIARKRIEKDLELIEALLIGGSLREAFEQNPSKQLVLHITGPTPKEHQVDLERILHAYQNLVAILPDSISDRVFLAFSVGIEDHSSFRKKRFAPLTMETIYRMANAVVLPSQTEGRGLPIIEASAIGIPIICSRYHPEEVFADVVGEGLSEELQIQYTLFPEDEFDQAFLSEVANLLLHKENYQARFAHNKAVIQKRYSQAALTDTFKLLLNQLSKLG